MLIRRAEIDAAHRCDVRVSGGRIVALAPKLGARPGETVVDARGGALLPGLHDHHVHLFAWAAALGSLHCGPPDVEDAQGLASALRNAPDDGGWLRAVGYHESVAGPLDRDALDVMLPERPLRMQHRSGAQWLLNGSAVRALGLDRGVDAPGVERDASGRATGRLWRCDAWLRECLPASPPPDLHAVGERLARCGVTGVTDATPSNGPGAFRILVEASARGALPQRLVVMGGAALPAEAVGVVSPGARKWILAETRLPDFDALAAGIAAAHVRGRAAALHCTTPAEAVFAAAALREAGARPGDRIEHGSLAPPQVVDLFADLGVTVVTQHHFVHERGDQYRVEVAPRDRPWLYRGRGWLAAGVPLAAGTDAPYGSGDPWRAMRAAVDRRTRDGAALGCDEALTPEQALALFSGPAHAPGDPAPRLAPGLPADLCLLDRPWREARERLVHSDVRATWCRGRAVYAAQGGEPAPRDYSRPTLRPVSTEAM